MENKVYRAINPHPEIPNRSNLIRPNVNIEKIGGTQDVEAEEYFYKISPCTVFQRLIGHYKTKLHTLLHRKTSCGTEWTDPG